MKFDDAIQFAKEFTKNPEKTATANSVMEKYGKMFHPDNIDNLTK